MKSDPMEFAKDILSRVSRSFALTIPMLDEEIKNEVLLAYLQDRILDNFEDEIHPPDLELQKEMMDKVSRIFSTEEYDRSSDFRVIKDKSELIESESLQKLTKNIDLIYQCYQDFDLDIQKISHKWLQEMNQGMQKYLTKEVQTFADLDEYCYYVAGTVGGFLTETIIYKFDINQKKQQILLDNFNQAGLFLQKVNLIRDIREDLASRDKHFWPLKELNISEVELSNSRNEEKALEALSKMLSDLKSHIPALKKYYQALPKELKGYKKFFAVNNALGLATIDKLENNADVFYGKKPIKVSKLKFLNIIRAPEKKFLDYCSQE
ncbi:farnesyl-diphosphate farnesyltransferase [Halanaerobium congolense]|jgi:farnesyl-diphosphate farnesyltransferase|uniref:Farnesyl-diphosphate farnesyltransferase n=1 Tax=Halanaerobium congolense TaxID=54121 RepID=A0A1M7N9N8_9FIRM|nr:squalene/phytoene synthase family protein [Halanaerobium congolense]PTX16713.1 farnesyl-diphosphate farnesyltransferase [Halanaerobium congolense]PXV64315.1 farnesyl-diphosphate farnesyltransferase [Halanaerobium congolense]TDS30167.1 farnesyl-diphosphate farnesyltransferase [Halanaerobium congolense]SDE82473.1 farnesyl-diphosphate farnesyltransferase [Halanaerobium congolense]SDG95610.1 farnesyl-diphosphate farnesyltransferase [Halanaerobium congolense]